MATRERTRTENGASPKRIDLSAFDKDVRDMLRKLKHGFQLERTGGGHYRIRHVRSDTFVTDGNGKNISIVTNPSPGVVRQLRDQLTEARVLRGTDKRQGIVTDEAKKNRLEGLRRMQQARDAKRRDEAQALHKRLADALDHVGGLDIPGRAQDLGLVGAMIAREQGKQITPDLLAGSARRIAEGGWVEVRYQEVWNALCERLERAPERGGEWYSMVREVRGLPADVVELRQVKGAQDEWPFRVELLPLDALLVDETYQRPVDWSFVRREAARFDHALVGTIDVAKRGPSRFAILDGQQRTEIVRLVNKGTIWCSVYEGLDRASEARYFLHKNDNRKNVHPYYTFKARVAAHDASALEIERLLTKYGYKVAIGAPRQGMENNISAITALDTTYKRMHHGTDTSTLEAVLDTLKRSTFGRESGQTSVLIRGLSYLYSQTEPDVGVIIEALAELGPTIVIGRGRDVKRTSGGSYEQAVARVLALEHDKRVTREHKLRWS